MPARATSGRIDLVRLALPVGALLDRATAIGAWLVLPLALLLFAQWPLRDLVGAGSRQANDIAQWIFALYVALALREATRRRAHMAADLASARHSPRWRDRLARFGEPVAVLPWSVFVLWAGAAPTWHSLHGLEAFPDTGHPLYFVIRLSSWLLALLMLVQALLVMIVGPQATTQVDGDERDGLGPGP